MYSEYMNFMILFLAPPGLGKTTFILNLMKEDDQSLFYFVSPLRALANEFFERSEKIVPTYLLRKRRDQSIDFNNFKCIVGTPEVLLGGSFNHGRSVIVIFDEIHLFFYWGDKFRPHLMEFFYEVASQGVTLWGLTATLSRSYLSLLEEAVHFNFDHSLLIDLGNFSLINIPSFVFPLSFLRDFNFEKIIYFCLKNYQRTLVFCRYREEVFRLENLFLEKGVKALGVVGGQTHDFNEKLRATAPDVIFSTTCLSHGVNIPILDAVVFTHKVERKDFYLQMMARAGREGQSFSVFTHNMSFHEKRKKTLLISVLKLWWYWFIGKI